MRTGTGRGQGRRRSRRQSNALAGNAIDAQAMAVDMQAFDMQGGAQGIESAQHFAIKEAMAMVRACCALLFALLRVRGCVSWKLLIRASLHL